MENLNASQIPALPREELVIIITRLEAEIAQYKETNATWKANFDTQHEDKASLQHQLRQTQLQLDAVNGQLRESKKIEQDYQKFKIKFEFLDNQYNTLLEKLIDNQR